VATCQFPVSDRIEANLGYIKRHVRAAKRRGADVAHFPEGALSGYAGTDFTSFAGFDWDALLRATAEVLRCAREAGIWVVLGSAHRLSDGHKPHNSLYVISDAGQIVDRYDKRFCGGTPDGQSGDLAHYSPGGHSSVWLINGVCCGALICYDYRFPELYRDYGKQGVELVFHSFHAAHASVGQVTAIGDAIGTAFTRVNRAATHTYPAITMPAAITAAAASNHVWISCPNSSAPQSLWPAFFVRADGVTVGRLRRNRPGVLVVPVDTEQDLYDSTAAWRGRAIAGELHSGTLVSDPRSADRTVLLGAETALGVGVAELTPRVEAVHEVSEVGQALVAGTEDLLRHGEDLAPMGPGGERGQLAFGEPDHGQHRGGIGDPGEVEGHAVLPVTRAEPELIGGDDADLADEQDRGQAGPDLVQGVQGGYRVLDGKQVFRLQFVAGARPEPGPEVREPVVPPAGHAELLGARVRGQAGHRVPCGRRGCGSEPGFLRDGWDGRGGVRG